jgi:hypothetical protein
MNTHPVRRGHLNRYALRALIAHDIRLAEALGEEPRSRAQIAIEAEMTPQALNDLVHGRRHGREPSTRGRIAVALGVDARALECLCTCPDDHEATT